MKWITREKIKVDRVACPWLIKKFVDPDAEFVFLPPDTDWANVKEGTVYDVPNRKPGQCIRRSGTAGAELGLAAVSRSGGTRFAVIRLTQTAGRVA